METNRRVQPIIWLVKLTSYGAGCGSVVRRLVGARSVSGHQAPVVVVYYRVTLHLVVNVLSPSTVLVVLKVTGEGAQSLDETKGSTIDEYIIITI